MINHFHKDRMFSFLFGRRENRDWTLSLYNAVNRTHYTNPEAIEITTIEDAVYMSMKNDLSFLLQYVMSIYEQQSTFNPNMPIRGLMYTGRLYDKYIHMNRLNIYGQKPILLPVPKLVVFYNGLDEKEDQILRLSDSFPDTINREASDIEVKVRMININQGKNKELMNACKPLAEYAWFVDRIRQNRSGMDIESAVDKAIDDMPEHFAIRNFLIGNRAEVKNMCITEYNEAETMRMLKEEWRKEGREEGREEGEEKLGKLMEKLLAEGRFYDIKLAVNDKATRQKLYEEFGITL